jgi:branched-chain amino acid transport system substrate-binding protein
MKRIGFATLLATISIALFSSFSISQEPIKIAVIMGLTGREASGWHIDAQLGARLAVKQWNEKPSGLLGRPVQLEFYDNHSDKLLSAELVKTAVKEGAIGLIGSRWSSLSLPIAIMAQKEKIPMVAANTAKEITEAGDHIFRISWSGDDVGKALAWYAHQKYSGDVLILRDIERESSTTEATAFIREYERLRPHGKCHFLTVENNQVDFSTVLKQIRAIKPDGIFLTILGNQSKLLFQQAEKMKLAANWLTDDSVGPKSLPETLGYNEISVATMYYADQNNVRLQKTIRAGAQLADELDLSPKNIWTSDPFPLFFDCTSLLLSAISRAGDTSASKIIDALQNIDHNGLTGPIRFDAHRNPQRDIYIMIATPAQAEFRYIEKIKPSGHTFQIEKL